MIKFKYDDITKYFMKKCSYCGRSEEEVKILVYHFKGKENYVCAKCLPVMIHGE